MRLYAFTIIVLLLALIGMCTAIALLALRVAGPCPYCRPNEAREAASVYDPVEAT